MHYEGDSYYGSINHLSNLSAFPWRYYRCIYFMIFVCIVHKTERNHEDMQSNRIYESGRNLNDGHK